MTTNARRQGSNGDDDADLLLTPGEVAKKYRVDPKTVTRWAKAGKLDSIRTPGNHHRFRASTIRASLGEPPAAAAEPAA